jgi:hypothetical protein
MTANKSAASKSGTAIDEPMPRGLRRFRVDFRALEICGVNGIARNGLDDLSPVFRCRDIARDDGL